MTTPDTAARRDHDQRVQRTRSAIVESFNDLVLNHTFDAVQVADIIDEAGVGRSTFYEHFRNKDDLLQHSATRILTILADATAPRTGDTAPLAHALQHFLDYRPAARNMLTGPAAAPLLQQLADLIEPRLAALCRESAATPALPLRLAAAQIAEAQFGLIRAWLDNPAACALPAIAAALLASSRALASSLAGRPA